MPKFVAEVILEDGSRIALTKGGALAYCETDRETYRAYLALTGERPLDPMELSIWPYIAGKEGLTKEFAMHLTWLMTTPDYPLVLDGPTIAWELKPTIREAMIRLRPFIEAARAKRAQRHELHMEMAKILLKEKVG